MIATLLIAGAALLIVLLLCLWAAIGSGYNRLGVKIVALVLMGILPGMWVLASVGNAFLGMETVGFCGQCHTMKDYVASLHSTNEDSLVATHYQNNRVPQNKPCYTCHVVHTPMGIAAAKLNGMKELFIEYFGTPKVGPEHRSKYNTHICLHCHEKAKNFREAHDDGEGQLAKLLSGEMSCLECHDVAHVIGEKKK